jgi:hypothetical protein
MATEGFTPIKGHCTCKAITYELHALPMFTNCCHCTWCQRETGSAFAMNAIIESSNFRITSATQPKRVNVPTASRGGQMMFCCPVCSVCVCSDFGGNGEWTTFVRVGTMNDEGKERVKPDCHIFTSTKLDWVDLTKERERGLPILEGRYVRANIWPKESNERFDALMKKMNAAKQRETA